MQSTNNETQLDSSGGNPITWLGFALITTVLFGLVYPTLTTLLGQTVFPHQARGSLIERDGKVIGSGLIGQSFGGEKYFIGRPSNAGKGNDPTSASGSNLAASNPALSERIAADAKDIAAREGIAVDQIPLDLLAMSGSGLDPDISPAAAELQVARVAKARGISEATLREAIRSQIEQPFLGVFGQARVNVLRLNLLLEK